MMRNKLSTVMVVLGIASTSITASAQQFGGKTGILSPFNTNGWGSVTNTFTGPGSAVGIQGGVNVINPLRWATGTDFFDHSNWSTFNRILHHPPIFPFSQAQLAGLIALMNPGGYASMINPVFYGQFMNPAFYLQFMNPMNWMDWWNPISYPANLNPITNMQWSSSLAYFPFFLSNDPLDPDE